MRIKVYASIDQLDLYNKGVKAGMSEDASDYLSHLEEIEIDLFVDSETGDVTGAEITQRF